MGGAMFLLITGGSASGKSAYAEQRVTELDDPLRYYVATMQSSDQESRERIRRHRRMRSGKGFVTVERPLDLPGLKLEHSGERSSCALLECLSNLAANEMFDPQGSHEQAQERIEAGIDSLMKQCDNLVVVTNEVFSDGVEYDPYTRRYLQLLGNLNCRLAARADEVIEVVCGIPCRLK